MKNVSQYIILVVIIFSFLFPLSIKAQENGVYSFLPTSPVLPFKPTLWSFSISPQNIPKPADWPGGNESKVFYRLLTHTQLGNNWSIKVGKGGQLYSIATPGNGELIPFQRQKGQWVDEVFQHTIPYNLPAPAVDGDMHQAGYYATSDLAPYPQLLLHSLYSPLFNNILPEFNNIDNSISFITWPQHAHLPRTYQENKMLMNENVRDLGDGVIEVTLVVNKWGGIPNTSISTPWSPIRTANAPTQIISNPDGSYRVDQHIFGQDTPVRLKDATTGGWFALTKTNQLNSQGIGFVFGNWFPDIENDKSFLLWGNYDSGETTGTVVSILRQFTFNPGDSVFFRYYIILGTLEKIQSYGNLLKDKVLMGKLETPENEARLLPVCSDPTHSLRRGCLSGQQPLFYSYRDFIRGTLPLFLIQNTTTQKYMLTSDPWKIDFPDIPYGKTKYIDFLGWVFPQSLTSASPFNYRLIKNILTDRSLFPATGADNTLTVRTLLTIPTPTSSPIPIPGDITETGDKLGDHVNINDYNLLVTQFGIPYNIFDYNLIVGNWAK